jgi:hypothetical protein
METAIKCFEPSEPTVRESDQENHQESNKPEQSSQAVLSVIPRTPADNDHEHPAGKAVSRQQLINILNYINFQDGSVQIYFRHPKYDKTVSLDAWPQPCLGDLLDCQWKADSDIHHVLTTYRFESLSITKGQKLLHVDAEVIRVDESGICLLLPDTCHEVSARRIKRYRCAGIRVQFIQNSSVFWGELLDFNALSFRVELTVAPPQTFEWIDPEQPVNLILSDQKEILYSGECQILRQARGQKTKSFVLTPLKLEIHRFKQKEFRSSRHELMPAPNLVFTHPFTNHRVDLKIIDLSGSGFSVEENENTAVLLPGMILPEVELRFANSFSVKCRSQVVYRKVFQDDVRGNWVKCGLALLDMNIQDHVNLVALLQQAKNRNAYICNAVDMDALWDFFFETGFIYPGKYAFIQKNKQAIKDTYQKLYTRSPHIARHFIYQEKGRILGHMAMLRFYENTWLIHHHAARKSSVNKAGLVVLDQIGRMGNDSHRLHSVHMKYLMCYYRPENKFPRRVFGGAAESINDLKGCSVDGFAYLHSQHSSESREPMPASWQLAPAKPDDISELENFYTYHSDGLMLKALDLNTEIPEVDELSSEYHKLGLRRERRLFAVREDGALKAIFMINLSDLGLNLSDLTNCIKIFVLDTDNFPVERLKQSIAQALGIIQREEMPILLFPVFYADQQGLHYEKIYNLWAFSMQYSDAYFRYLKRLLRFV